MKFSVIVPVYNAEEYLLRCINSLMKQTYQDFEVIMVDDGSSDNSSSLCSSLCSGDSRFIIISKKNGGVSSARNIGLKRATGEWICFVDADDEVLPNYLDFFAKQISERTADLYMASFNLIKNNNQKEYLLKNKTYNHDERILLYLDLRPAGKFGIPWNKCYKASIIKKHGIEFDERLHRAEDELFNLLYLSHSDSVVSSSEIIYNYYRYNYLTGAVKFPDFGERALIARLIRDASLTLSENISFKRKVREMYVDYLMLSIRELYWKFNYPSLGREARYNSINQVRLKVKETGDYPIYKKLLLKHKFIVDNNFIIDILGSFSYLINKYLK